MLKVPELLGSLDIIIQANIGIIHSVEDIFNLLCLDGFEESDSSLTILRRVPEVELLGDSKFTLDELLRNTIETGKVRRIQIESEYFPRKALAMRDFHLSQMDGLGCIDDGLIDGIDLLGAKRYREVGDERLEYFSGKLLVVLGTGLIHDVMAEASPCEHIEEGRAGDMLRKGMSEFHRLSREVNLVDMSDVVVAISSSLVVSDYNIEDFMVVNAIGEASDEILFIVGEVDFNGFVHCVP